MTTQHSRQQHDGLTYGGIAVVALAAAVMSAAAWAKLGELVGITQTADVKLLVLHLSWLLPVAVDAYALLTARVWLALPWVSAETRSYAKKTAIGAIILSIGGNALYHLVVELDLMREDIWPVIVVVVSGIPALMLGAALHLLALVHGDRRRQNEPAPETSVPAAEPTPAGTATNAGAGVVAPAPVPMIAPAAPSPAAGPLPEAAPVPALDAAPEISSPVVAESAPVAPSPAAPVSAPEAAPVEPVERSAPAAPVTAPEHPTGAPAKPRPEQRTGARSGGRHRSTAKARSGQRSGAPSKEQKIRAAVDAIVDHYNRWHKKPSQRELKLALEFPPRNDDMPEVYRLADEALAARKAVNS